MKPSQSSKKAKARSTAAKKGWITRRLNAEAAQILADIKAGEKILRAFEKAATKPKEKVKKKRAPVVKRASSIKLKKKPEKKKPKKKKPKKKKPVVCNYSKVIEQINQYQITKLNVSGVQSLSPYCLAKLLDEQIAKGAYLFRFWYSGNSYYKGADEGKIRSTPLINAKRVQIEFGSTAGFLKQIGGHVMYYWADLHAKGRFSASIKVLNK